DCPKARDVLIVGGFDNRLLINKYEFFIDCIEDSMHLLDKKAFEDFITTPPRICKWEKPLEGVIKVNVYASVNVNRTDLGIIVRDSDGFILSGKAVFISKVVNSEWAKLDALLEHKDDITIFGYHIKEAHKILDSFSKFEVKWMDCGCNKVANSLCNWSLSNCCNLSFEMDYPSDIHNLVIS
ncbi:hypothetical protein Goari_016987, partial [Gossypium aridum]|nr:hypothetical protein [Gossypium aridum]